MSPVYPVHLKVYLILLKSCFLEKTSNISGNGTAKQSHAINFFFFNIGDLSGRDYGISLHGCLVVLTEWLDGSRTFNIRSQVQARSKLKSRQIVKLNKNKTLEKLRATYGTDLLCI